MSVPRSRLPGRLVTRVAGIPNPPCSLHIVNSCMGVSYSYPNYLQYEVQYIALVLS